MKKIVMIIPNAFPVPAIRGGAVETIVTHLLNENENEKQLEFEVFSIWDKEIEKFSKKYKNSSFYYIKVPFNLYIEKLKGKWREYAHKALKNAGIIKKCFVYGIFEILNINNLVYKSKISSRLKKMDYDYLIVEGGQVEKYSKILKRVPYEKRIVHLHATIKQSEILARDFKYFIAVSRYVKKEFLKGDRIRESQVKVIENCIEQDVFNQRITEAERSAIRKKLEIKENEIVIIYCGRTIKEKGIRELIEAYKKMNKYETTKLVIVGNSLFSNQVQTEYDKELKELASSIKENIIFTGFVPNQEVYKMYQIANISVVPSLCEEAFGLVVVEAMRSRLPIITTNAGGIPEIVDEKCAYVLERDGRLVDNMAEIMEELVENPEKRKKMGEIGYQLSLQYNRETYYRRFMEIIQEIEQEK